MSDFSRLPSGFSLSFGLSVYLGFLPSSPSSFHPSRCRLVFSHGSSPSGVTFIHRFRLSSPAPALSLSLPLFLWVFQFLSTVHSICFWDRFSFSTWLLAPWLLALYFAWVAGCFVARAPLCLSVFLRSSWGSRLPHSRLPPSSWILLRFLSFARPLFCFAISLLPFTFPLVFHPEVSASAFPSYCLLSSSALLFFLYAGGIGRLAWLFPRSSSTVLGLPFFLFPSGSSLPVIL